MKTLTIFLPKLNKMNWWNGVVKGDPTIDTQAIVPESSVCPELPKSVALYKLAASQNRGLGIVFVIERLGSRRKFSSDLSSTEKDL